MSRSTPTSPPTAVPTFTPSLTVTPTPTPVPPQVSSPFVGPAGGLAYVEDGRLVVVGADGQATVVAEEGVAHDTRPVAWSPQGTYLAYSLTGPDADIGGLVLWDRATGERRRLIAYYGTPAGAGLSVKVWAWFPN